MISSAIICHIHCLFNVSKAKAKAIATYSEAQDGSRRYSVHVFIYYLSTHTIYLHTHANYFVFYVTLCSDHASMHQVSSGSVSSSTSLEYFQRHSLWRLCICIVYSVLHIIVVIAFVNLKHWLCVVVSLGKRKRLWQLIKKISSRTSWNCSTDEEPRIRSVYSAVLEFFIEKNDRLRPHLLLQITSYYSYYSQYANATMLLNRHVQN